MGRLKIEHSRRRIVFGLAAAALVLRPAAAQPRSLRIGWLSTDRSANSPFFAALRAGLRDLGYIEGRNLFIEARWGEGSTERMDELAKELVALRPSIIVAQGGPSTLPLMRAGAAMPVVFGFSGDPVEAKVVESLARPGGNFTGMSFLSLELVGKRIELLKQVVPTLERVAILARPEHPGQAAELRVSEIAARALGLAVSYHPVRNAAEFERALAEIVKARSGAIVVFPDASMMRYSERIAGFATTNRIPAISGWSEFADRGNVMTYGPNLRDVFRRLAWYVDKIARGTKPSELSVELPTTVELVINQKAVNAIGLDIPQAVRLRADRVIE